MVNRRGRNNRGFHMPEAERWGVRKWWSSGGREYRYKVVWHRQNVVADEYLLATHLTFNTAAAMVRVLTKGKLGQ